jgi:hypothetical protein
LGCISSFLNLDTFSTKRKKSLHQRLQSTNGVRISEFKNIKKREKVVDMKQYSHGQRKRMADELQEKQLQLLPSSDASEVVHQNFSSEGLVMV